MPERPAQEPMAEDSYDPSHREEWLGGEAHVRFRNGQRDRRSLLINRRGGYTGTAMGLAALAGACLGSLLIALVQARRG